MNEKDFDREFDRLVLEGYFEVSGTDTKGQVTYRLTSKGEQYMKEIVERDQERERKDKE
jgi:DNA-binding PadR family transcriptional regulator